MSSSTHNPQHQQHFQEQRAQQAADREPRSDARKEFGTNSPPLEATGSARPMGMASVDGDVDAGHVSDGEQRKGYFGGEQDSGADKMEKERALEKEQQTRKVGQSMAAQMDERT